MLRFARLTVVPVAVLLLVFASAAQAQLFGFPPAQPKRAPQPTGPAIAVFSLDGPIIEKPGSDDPLFGNAASESLQSLVARMDAAAQDDNVKAAVLLLGNTSFGRGQVEEIRAAMQRLKDAGKPVHAHADSVTTESYALLCGASRLSVAPTGDVWVTGLYGEGLYVRGLLNLLGVEPDFLTCGDYKSAAETFTRSEPSDKAAEMEKWLFDSMYESLVASIAAGRGVDAATVRGWIDQGLYSAQAAQEAGMIDAVEHRQEFEANLHDEFGDDIRLDKKYAQETGRGIDLSNPLAAMTLLMGGLDQMQNAGGKKDAIAIVYVDGAIQLGDPPASLLGAIDGAYSGPIRRALDRVAADDHVKAVVLRVNSPGGSAIASEIILHATQRVREKKPIVVSMGDVAGSGGYYVACGVDRIYADRSTITGSIGVVAGKVSTTDMWRRLGIHFHPIERGKNADILSTSDVFTDEQRALLQTWMDEVYGVFKQHVVDARGERLKKPIDELAGGRVYTGEQGLELGLLDEIGGLDAAVAHIAREAGLDDYEIETVPEAKSFIEKLLAGLTGEESDESPGLGMSTSPRLSQAFLEQLAPVLATADPHRVRLLQQAAVQLDILHQERLSLTMPLLDLHD